MLLKSRVRENFKHGSVRGRAVEAFYSTCTDAEGGRERPARPRIGGGNKMPPTLGASAKARSAEPCEPAT